MEMMMKTHAVTMLIAGFLAAYLQASSMADPTQTAARVTVRRIAGGDLTTRLSCETNAVSVASSPYFTWQIENASKTPIRLLNQFATVSWGSWLRLQFRPKAQPDEVIAVGLDPRDTVYLGTQSKKILSLAPGDTFTLKARAELKPFFGANQDKPLPPGEYTVSARFTHDVPSGGMRTVLREEIPDILGGNLDSNDIMLTIRK